MLAVRGLTSDHYLFSWEAPGGDARSWPTLRGATFTVQPALITADVHLIRTCCVAGLGIGLVPSAELADPGVPADLLVPALPDMVGRERPVRISVPFPRSGARSASEPEGLVPNVRD